MSSPEDSNTIVIVGGGFSGTMAAVNLVRFAERPVKVIVVNKGRPFGRGAAYGTHRGEYLLNVAARNMSAFPDCPTHFVDWLQTRHEYRDVPLTDLREQFMPRRVYGDYIRGLAESCFSPLSSRSPASLAVIEDEVVALHPGEGGARVELADRDPIPARSVLLATGNQPPASFPSETPLAHDDRYCADPWSDWQSRLPGKDGRIVLLGTGLTMVDVIVTLEEIGWKGSITACSRHGMLPRPHFRGVAYPDYLEKEGASPSLARLVKLVEHHCAKLQEMTQNPGIAVDKLRPHTQRIWKSLSTEEKREFLSKHAARWNVVRHRIAKSIHEKVSDAFDSGRLEIVSGNIRSLAARDQGIEVLLKDGEQESIMGDLVINCTGPKSSFSRSDVPLFQQMLQGGIVQPDPLDMGIETAEDFAVTDGEGKPSSWLYAMGPLCKGTLWETTAVPELRVQAANIAQTLLKTSAPLVTEEEPVIEYSI